jgi:Fe-S-cluster containining protein
MTTDGALAAGGFSEWMAETHAAIRGERASDVPCGTCTACCRSSQFIHIGPDETDTLAHIPNELLFPAPRLPRGHVLMGYDERGHCPMLVDDQCTIYEHRPQTCRTYDCRVFPAAGVEPDDDKLDIASRARRWQFDFSTEHDRIQHDAVRRAAQYLSDHPEAVPGGGASNATQHAVQAIEAHALFMSRTEPAPEAVRVELARHPRPNERGDV